MKANGVEFATNKTYFWGIIIILLQLGVFYLIWMNPFVNEISLSFADNPAVKPYEHFGGLNNWMSIRLIYNIALLVILYKVFLMFYNNVPGQGWKKGINYGLIISLVSIIPAVYNKWALVVYPNELILFQLINGVVSMTISGVLMAVISQNFCIKKCDSH